MENLSELHAADINRLEAHHQTLLDLCLQLEEAAEDVQTPGSPQDYIKLADAIPRLLDETHELEETVLFPDFQRQSGSYFAGVVIERLKAEHRCDRLSAEELSRTLRAVANGQCKLAPDTVAYMVRGFLESLRRHILSEKLMLEALLAAKSEQREVFG
ncbi:hemerythrin domain-containing protein [Brucella sp. 6810]|uniref:hemerythrin domain-containing protein n=1 Tax=Brucella sp. 6810 TaxID=2769351 RepID=UPI00165C28D2|nr:hemerythrin domain-containing protein [Brucella sp. 6810]QNQ64072.1 hemerythrin domain-containing protein [Brucella sp. 6810]